MKTFRQFAQLFPVAIVLFGVTACNKPSKEQIVQALKDDPSLLASAIQKDPEAFKEALQTAQDVMRRERAKEQQEQQAKEQEAQFAKPLEPKLTAAQVYSGSNNAKLVIVEYTDFECPYCSKGADTMKEVLKQYEGKVKVTVKHLPLPFHSNAMPAAKYFEAIRMQDPKAALQFHDNLFAKQNELRQGGEKFLEAEAKKLGVKMDKLKADLDSKDVKEKIEADMSEARSFGFRGTPSFLVGGVAVRGALPPEEFAKIIDKLLGKKG